MGFHVEQNSDPPNGTQLICIQKEEFGTQAHNTSLSLLFSTKLVALKLFAKHYLRKWADIKDI